MDHSSSQQSIGSLETVAGKGKHTSVSFDPAVLNLIDQLAEREDRNRSQMINVLIKRYAAKEGISLPTPGLEKIGQTNS